MQENQTDLSEIDWSKLTPDQDHELLLAMGPRSQQDPDALEKELRKLPKLKKKGPKEKYLNP